MDPILRHPFPPKQRLLHRHQRLALRIDKLHIRVLVQLIMRLPEIQRRRLPSISVRQSLRRHDVRRLPPLLRP